MNQTKTMNQIKSLIPIIILKSYNKNGNWVGPIEKLKHPDFDLTWAFMNDESISYLTHEEEKKFNSDGVDFKELAIDNLDSFTEDPFTGHKEDENGLPIYCVMMHKDGLGSSRLLLLYHFNYDEFEENFKEGYFLALPERSVALVIRKDATEDQINEFKELVQKCYDKGTTPMSPNLFEINDLNQSNQ